MIVARAQLDRRILNPKLEIIARRRWPAVILAAKRTPKEIILAIWLTVSIKTKAGAKPIGAPKGVNIEKNLSE